MRAAVGALALAVLLPGSAFAGDAASLRTAMLKVHNEERAAVGIAPLVWSDRLAADAAVWVAHLAKIGRLEHAGRDINPDEGENLWAGTAGAYGKESMARGWASEKKDFRYGIFPDVSRTGRWQDAGHYTQMIWKDTTQIGCALASGGGWDYLACRYAPPGNFVGQAPY